MYNLLDDKSVSQFEEELVDLLRLKRYPTWVISQVLSHPLYYELLNCKSPSDIPSLEMKIRRAYLSEAKLIGFKACVQYLKFFCAKRERDSSDRFELEYNEAIRIVEERRRSEGSYSMGRSGGYTVRTVYGAAVMELINSHLDTQK